MRWRLWFAVALIGSVTGCGSGEPILLDPVAEDDDTGDDDTGDDDTGDDDTGDDDTGDDDTGPACEWDGDYIGETILDFYFWETQGQTHATVLDCQITGDIRFDLGFDVFFIDLLGGIDFETGSAAGVIQGDFDKLGTIDEAWNGQAYDNSLDGEFLLEMGPALGTFDLDRE
jgi:hypothetical protein